MNAIGDLSHLPVPLGDGPRHRPCDRQFADGAMCPHQATEWRKEPDSPHRIPEVMALCPGCAREYDAVLAGAAPRQTAADPIPLRPGEEPRQDDADALRVALADGGDPWHSRVNRAVSRARDIRAFIEAHPAQTTTTVAAGVGLQPETARRLMVRLREIGRLEATGSGSGMAWWLPGRAPADLTVSEAEAYHEISGRPGRVSDIARRLGKHRSRMSEIVATLAGHGLIVTDGAPQATWSARDRRGALTPTAHRVAEALSAEPMRLYRIASAVGRSRRMVSIALAELAEAGMAHSTDAGWVSGGTT